jgi:hypothetical protein
MAAAPSRFAAGGSSSPGAIEQDSQLKAR